MVRKGQHSGIDDETRARARKFVENADTPRPAVTAKPKPPKPAVTANPKPSKNRVVSKKELEESGLSLRDFLNRERGLTRRGMSKAAAEKQLELGEKPSASAVVDAKQQLGFEPLSSTRKPGTNVNYENTDVSDMTFKRGGKVYSASKRADGIAIRGKTRA